MRVLVACEFSGVVREAFRRQGHDAWSCDLIDTETPGQHVIEDALYIAYLGIWDLLIAHPPCTFLSRVAVRWLDQPGRREKREEAFRFFVSLLEAPVLRVCVENPVGYAWTHRRPDQSIEPFQFGHEDRKKTCLWLRGLPLLRATTPDAAPPEHLYVGSDGNKRFRTAAIGGKVSEKWKKRSRTFEGIAAATAEQWGSL